RHHLVRRGDAEEGSDVRARTSDARRDLVAFAHLLFDDVLEVGEHAEAEVERLFQAGNAGRLACERRRIVIFVGRTNVLVENRGPTRVDVALKVPNDGLVVVSHGASWSLRAAILHYGSARHSDFYGPRQTGPIS